MVKRILTEEEQILKDKKAEKSKIYRDKKLSSLCDKFNKCNNSTMLLIYHYLNNHKIPFYNDDDNENEIFEMEDLTNKHIKEINAIIKKHINIKPSKSSKSIPVKNYNYELVLFDDN